MLTRVYIDNYKCFVNFEFTAGRLNLLLGENGSGKSTFLDVLAALQALLSGDEPEFLAHFPDESLTRWQSSNVQTFELEMAGDGGHYVYRLEIAHEGRDLRLRKEVLRFNGVTLFASDGARVQILPDEIVAKGTARGTDIEVNLIGRSHFAVLEAPSERHGLITRFKTGIRRIHVGRIVPSSMNGTSDRDDPRPSRDLSNFASWYRHMAQEQQGQIISVTQTLQGIIPGFDSFRLVKEGEHTRVLKLLIKGAAAKAVEYNLEEISDGQRVLVALYTLLTCAVGEGDTLCLDEPENFLALPEIQPWLTALVDRVEDGGGQAFLISHHPELINYLASSAGRWFERSAGGPVRVRAISADDSGLPISELVARGWLHG